MRWRCCWQAHDSKESEVDSNALRFFRAVDQAILEHHSRTSGLPLIPASLPEHFHMYAFNTEVTF